MAEGVKISALTETLNVTGDEYVIINQDGVTKRTKISNITSVGGGSGSLTGEYVELTAETGEVYRLKVDDKGELIAYNPEVDTAEPAQADAGQNILFDGLIINQIYGTGNDIKEQPVTHSFIELYNLRPEALNLKGLYLFVRGKAGSWQSLELKGIVPSKHSFLIRCARIKNDTDASVRIAIKDYDMSWDIKLPSTGFSAYLKIGSATPEDAPVRATYTTDSSGTTSVTWTNPNYIDLLAGGGSGGEDQTVMAYEKYYWMAMNDHTGIMRKDFMHAGTYKPSDAAQSGQNKAAIGNNQGDTIIVDYKTCDTSKFRPRSLRDGAWNVYATKDTMNPGCPNMVNICYGENGNTSRTFTWQSTLSNMGQIRYRKQGELKWKSKETTREIVTHLDCEAMVHRVIIHDLEPGTYEYMCGQDGAWSAIETFEVKNYTNETPIKFAWVSDNQSWTSEEGVACDVALRNIMAHEVDEHGELDFDWVLHTGDVSQNANRTFEFRDYYASSRQMTKNMCHQMTCGNNDLVQKKFSDAWSWYITAENQWANSVYAYDLGYTHFVCLNSNTDSTYVDGIGSIGGYANTDAFLEAQAEWLDQHLTQVAQRPEKPRWTIIYMHLSPFTVSRAKRLQCFVPVFEKHKVPLVLCGHNHTTTRSKALYTGYQKGMDYFDYQTTAGVVRTMAQVENDGMMGTNSALTDEAGINHEEDLANGTHYVMINATGYKLSGKEKIVTIHNDLRQANYTGTFLNSSGKSGHDNGLSQPWWYKKCTHTTQPTYAMVEITYDTITVTIKVIKNTLVSDANKNTFVQPFGEQTVEQHDQLIINYSDRSQS